MRCASRFATRLCFVLGAAVAVGWVLHTSLRAVADDDAASEASPQEAPILAALSTVQTTEFQEVPLSDVTTFLEQEYGIQAEIDLKALEEAGLTADVPVSKNLRSVQLRSALNLILDPLGLGWTIHHGVLWITTKDEVDNQGVIRVYSIGDLLNEDGELTEEVLADLIESTIAPHSWDEVGGPGRVHDLPGQLAIRQTYQIHEKTARLLADLRAAKEGQAPANRQTEPERLVRAALEVVEPFEMSSVTLADLATVLRENFAINVEFDAVSLQEAGISMDLSFSKALKGIPLASALSLVLEPMGMSWVVDNEVLLITTKDRVDNRLDTRVYLVDHLLQTMDYDDLIKAITSTVRPDTWDEVGGPGSIREVPKALVISQTDAIHAEISKFLSQIGGDIPLAADEGAEKYVLVSYSVGLADVDDVAKALQQFVVPESWEGMGGQGTMAVIHSQAAPAAAVQVADPTVTRGGNAPLPQPPAAGQPVADSAAAAGAGAPPPPAQGAGTAGQGTGGGGWLMIRQTRGVHRQIKKSLHDLNPSFWGGQGGGGGGGQGGGGGFF